MLFWLRAASQVWIVCLQLSEKLGWVPQGRLFCRMSAVVVPSRLIPSAIKPLTAGAVCRLVACHSVFVGSEIMSLRSHA